MMARVIWEDIPTWVNHEKKTICYTPVKSGHSTLKHILESNGYERVSKMRVNQKTTRVCVDLDQEEFKTTDYSINPYYDSIWDAKPSAYVVDPETPIIAPLQVCLGLEDYTSYLFIRHPVSRFFSGLLTELDNSAVTMTNVLADDPAIPMDQKMPKLVNMFRSYMENMWAGDLNRIILPNLWGQFASHCWVLSRDYYKGLSIYDYVDHFINFDTANDPEFKGAVNIHNVKQLTQLGIVDEISAELDYSENPSSQTLYDAFNNALYHEFLEEVEQILWEESVHIKVNEHKFLGKPNPTPLLQMLNNMARISEEEDLQQEFLDTLESDDPNHTKLTRREKVLLDPLSASQNKSSE